MFKTCPNREHSVNIHQNCPEFEDFSGFFRDKVVRTGNLPSVLVPSLDLGVGEVEPGRQLHAVLNAEVLLLLKTLLERFQLVVRERRPCFAWFFRSFQIAFKVVVVFICRGRKKNAIIGNE